MKNKKKVNIFTKQRKAKLDKAFRDFDKGKITNEELKEIYNRTETELEDFFVTELYVKLDDMVDFSKEFLYRTPYVHKEMLIDKEPNLQYLIDEFKFKILEFKRERYPDKKQIIVLQMQDLVEKAKLFDYSLVDRKLHKWENGVYKEVTRRREE